VTLAGEELDQQARTAARTFPRGRGDLDLTVEHHQPRALVHLMLGETLAGRKIKRDCSRHVARGEDLR
jgi:hypothetical protein